MKNIYMKKLGLLVVLVGFSFVNTFAQFVSKPVAGQYENASSWEGSVPPVGGNDYRPLTIVETADITKSADFTGQAVVTVNGRFTVNGDFISGYGGTVVNGMLIVNRALTGAKIRIGDNATLTVTSFFDGTGGVTIGDNATLTVTRFFDGTGGVTIGNNAHVDVQSFKGTGGVTIGADATVTVSGTFDTAGGLQVGDKAKVNVINFSMGGGSIANIKGDLIIEGNLVGGGSNFIIHNGVTVSVNGNVDANVPIEVRDGGTLIVNGSYKNGQNLTIAAGGLVEVAGVYNSNGALNNSGVLLVRGDYINNSGGNGLSVLGQGYLDIGGDLVANKAVKVEAEAVLIVRGNVFYENSQSGMNIDGTMVVSKDFSITNGYISNTGKVVVGGAFTFAGGGFSSPDKKDSGEAYLYLLDENAEHFYIDYSTGNTTPFVKKDRKSTRLNSSHVRI